MELELKSDENARLALQVTTDNLLLKAKVKTLEETVESLKSETPRIDAGKDDSWTSGEEAESAIDGEETESDDLGKKK